MNVTVTEKVMITKKHFNKTTGGEKQSPGDSDILILPVDNETLTKHLQANPLTIWLLSPPGGKIKNKNKMKLQKHYRSNTWGQSFAGCP